MYTVIQHEIKRELGISFTEYVICDYIYHMSNNPKSKLQGWCYSSLDTKAKYFDLSRRAICKIQNRLIEKGLIQKDEEGHLKTTSSWFLKTITNECELQVVNKVHQCSEQSSPAGSEQSSPNIYKDLDKDSNNNKTYNEYILPTTGTGTEAKALLDYFFNKHLEIKKTKYIVKGAKDINLFKSLLVSLTAEQLKVLINRFFALQSDPFVDKAGYTVGVFYGIINKLNAQTEPIVKCEYGVPKNKGVPPGWIPPHKIAYEARRKAQLEAEKAQL